MLALYIIGGILLVLIILLNCPLVVSLQYQDKDFNVRVRYLFFTLFPREEKPELSEEEKASAEKKKKEKSKKALAKSKSKPAKKKESAKPSAETTVEERRAEMLEKAKLVIEMIKSSRKAFRHFIKGIQITDIRLDFVAANEDAYEAALLYGKLNMLVFNMIAFIRTFFTISIEKINITCCYNSAESRYDGKCRLQITPGTLLIVFIRIIYHYLVNTYKQKKLRERNDDHGTPNSGDNEHSNGENS